MERNLAAHLLIVFAHQTYVSLHRTLNRIQKQRLGEIIISKLLDERLMVYKTELLEIMQLYNLTCQQSEDISLANYIGSQYEKLFRC